MSQKLIAPVLISAVVVGASIAPPKANAQLSSNAKVVATGLEAPRGLKFGPDGDLYVAEAGTGGTNSTAGMCPQVVPPIGPYHGGLNARISKFDKNWNRTTVASGLPSAINGQANPAYLGVADLSFIGGTLYALIAGGGCSHGNPTMPAGVVVVNTANGNWHYVADISSFLHANPVAYPNPGDFEPDGSLYGMIAVHEDLNAVEPNAGEVLKIDPKSGDITRQIDVSASQGHVVPTVVLYHDGKFLMGNLNLFPIEPHTSRVMTLSKSNIDESSPAPGLSVPGPYHIIASKAGFATITGLVLGPDGLVYVLQMAPGTPSEFPAPGFGKVTRINADGTLQDVVTGLSLPTGITFGPNVKARDSRMRSNSALIAAGSGTDGGCAMTCP